MERELIMPVILALGLGAGCRRDEAELPKPIEAPVERTWVDDEPHYPAIDPASVTPLEVLHFPEPVGDGYERVPVQLSKPLYSGKWLGLANGDGEFMGPRHVIVNQFRSRPDSLGEGELEKSVLLNVETGEIVAEYARGRYVQWHWGLAIVFRAGDERPYLLDAQTGKFVLAVPEGEHAYVYGENYWLRFSPIARRVWVTARDTNETVHLYAWEQLQAPPGLPDNPFPFMPDRWDPMDSQYFDAADTEEVQPDDKSEDGCTRAILRPPMGYECLDDEQLERTLPLAGGWRVDPGRDLVFNRHTQVGYRFDSLCPEAHPVFLSLRHRSPPTVEVRCSGDASALMIWTPPDHVRRIEPKYATRLSKGESILLEYEEGQIYEISDHSQSSTISHLDTKERRRELVGHDYQCDDPIIRGGRSLQGEGCRSRGGQVEWFEIINRDDERRSSRFNASRLCVSKSHALAVAVVRHGGQDQVVRVGL